MNSIPSISKVVLVPTRQVSGEAGSVYLRRYRMSQLRINEPIGSGEDRFAHLKRCYD